MAAKNPFTITTAVDYSDAEINKYWVDVPFAQKKIFEIINTSSPMPMLILGGKGSGKTHLMRYFSFNAKKIRHEDNLKGGLEDDKYIGIYLRCGGLNSDRFSESHIGANASKTLFAYYIELWFTQLLLQILEDICLNIPEVKSREKSVCEQVVKTLFDTDLKESTIQSFAELKELLKKFQNQMDFEMNNSSITGKSLDNVQINTTRGKLIFGLPQLLKAKVPLFKDFQFIYLIDEFENLTEEQQRYINTLLRHREAPVTFRVGARWYGVKTYKTYSGNEEIKAGSEYERHIIDKLLRENIEAYEAFVNEMCLNRLRESGYTVVNPNPEENSFSSYFEEFDTESTLSSLKEKNRFGHFETLRSKLKSKVNLKDEDEIISNLSNSNPVIERTSVMLFYREWNDSKGANLLKSSKEIKKDTSKFINAKSRADRVQTRHFKVLDKFRADIVDQLLKEARERIPYTGFEKLTKMSSGIPRLLLITLKHIYRWAIFNQEKPFQNEPITNYSQIKGVDDAYNWFLEDARVPGPNGKRISDAITRLGQFLQELKFSDVPPECSISTFSINITDISENVRQVLDYLEQYSYIINVTERTDKNSVRKFETYQMNGIIAPKWDLALYRRGIVKFTRDEVNAIFDSGDDSFEKVRRSRMSRYNFPFANPTTETPLFDLK